MHPFHTKGRVSQVAGCPTDLSLQCGALAIGAVVAKLAAGAQASKESCRDLYLRSGRQLDSILSLDPDALALSSLRIVEAVQPS